MGFGMSITIVKELDRLEQETKLLWQTISDTRHQVGTMRQEFYELLKRTELMEKEVNRHLNNIDLTHKF